MAYNLDAEFIRGAIQGKADSEIISQEQADKLCDLDVDILEEAFEEYLDNDQFWNQVDNAVESVIDDLLAGIEADEADE